MYHVRTPLCYLALTVSQGHRPRSRKQANRRRAEGRLHLISRQHPHCAAGRGSQAVLSSISCFSPGARHGASAAAHSTPGHRVVVQAGAVEQDAARGG